MSHCIIGRWRGFNVYEKCDQPHGKKGTGASQYVEGRFHLKIEVREKTSIP